MLVSAAKVLRCRPAEPGLDPIGGEGPGLIVDLGMEPVVGLESAEWWFKPKEGLRRLPVDNALLPGQVISVVSSAETKMSIQVYMRDPRPHLKHKPSSAAVLEDLQSLMAFWRIIQSSPMMLLE